MLFSRFFVSNVSLHVSKQNKSGLELFVISLNFAEDNETNREISCRFFSESHKHQRVKEISRLLLEAFRNHAEILQKSATIFLILQMNSSRSSSKAHLFIFLGRDEPGVNAILARHED